VSKDKLHELLCQLWHRDISADDAFDELEELINHIKRLEEALDEVYHAGRVGASLHAEKAWRKSKEEKP
jgi:hypothetical protein